MYEIIKKRELAQNVHEYVINAPHVAKHCLAGQFIILRSDEKGERVPFTICDYDREKGTVSILVQTVGYTTAKLATMKEGDCLESFAGPLGNPTDLSEYKNILLVGGGIGVAVVYPQAKQLTISGKKADAILGARNKDLIFFEDEMGSVCNDLYIMTDDGTEGQKGFVTDKINELFSAGKKYDVIFAVGPMPMMKAVTALAVSYGVKCIVSMNSMMVDGTGMCGCCRVMVDGQVKYACIDGPEFDGALINFDEAMARSKFYHEQEKEHYCNLRDGNVDKRHDMTLQPVEQRIKNFDEVALGFDDNTAMLEAQRCLNCKNPQCVKGCPVSVNIPQFISALRCGDPLAAADIIKQTNNLPAICGRVCPQEKQCEAMCIRKAKLGGSVAIGALERYCADIALKKNSRAPKEIKKNGKRVAVIGSGPSGLTCAADLASNGVEVVLFEALHKAGGVLIYGIPEFRLPKEVVGKEIERVKELGVEIRLNEIVGKTVFIDELLEHFDAVFIGSGAGLPVFLNVEGENLCGVYSANEYLTRINLMKAYKSDSSTPLQIAKNPVIIGAGNVGMDAARTALRISGKATLVYRRTKEEMPARYEEILHAEEEGVKFELLTAPKKILGKDGYVTGLLCQKMALGEKDASGRAKPVPVEGSDFVIECDQVIVALGTKPNPIIKNSCRELETTNKGIIVTEETTGQTSIDRVYAGGDAQTGAATVISAMGAGKRAAKSIMERLGIAK